MRTSRYNLPQALNKKATAAAIAALVILIVAFPSNTSLLARFMIVTFMAAAVSYLGQCVSIFMQDGRAYYLFKKSFAASFLVFWFGMITFGAYAFACDGSYMSLILFVPFIAVGIGLVRRHLFG